LNIKNTYLINYQYLKHWFLHFLLNKHRNSKIKINNNDYLEKAKLKIKIRERRTLSMSRSRTIINFNPANIFVAPRNKARKTTHLFTKELNSNKIKLKRKN
jgi:hypothetical protein